MKRTARTVQPRLLFPIEVPPVAAQPSSAANLATRRSLGAFYTPSTTADFIADWAIRSDGEHVLEPSFGSGMFLRAILQTAFRKGFSDIHVTGVEIDPAVHAQAIREGLIAALHAHCADFLDMPALSATAIIGNPPYIRLRHLASSQRQRALCVARDVLGRAMDPSGSLWMPFLLHAMQCLKRGGRLAFILPYEITYVRYARPLWAHLAQRFGSLHIIRTHERLFPEILQDAVLLLADEYGATTENVHFQAFESAHDVFIGQAMVDTPLRISSILQGERTFLEALLGDEMRALLHGRIAAQTTPARDSVTFNIGYVAGDKTFFHPNTQTRERFELPETSLRAACISARRLKGNGAFTSSMNTSEGDALFYPESNALTKGDQRYIAYGESQGIVDRYKCRARNPWFKVPDVRVPDVIVSVFSERPLMMINDAAFVASNSLLCGFCRRIVPESLLMGWYTSLTLLQCELEVHSLGGGVLVLVPREAGNIRLPMHIRTDAHHIRVIDQLLRGGKIADAYRAGDQTMLAHQLGFGAHEIHLIHQAIATLSHWRTAARTAKSGQSPDTVTQKYPKKAYGR